MTIHIKANPDRDGGAGEGSTAYTLTKPIDPAQLDTELGGLGLVIEGDVSAASKASPVSLWVLGEAEESDLRTAVSAHQISAPVEDPLVVLRAKAETKKDFTASEIQQVLRALVLRT